MNLATVLVATVLVAPALAAPALAAAVVPLAAPAAQDTTAPIVNAAVVFGESKGLIVVEAEHFHKQTLTDKRAWHLNSPRHRPQVWPDHDVAPVADAGGLAYVEVLPDTFHSDEDPIINGDNLSGDGGLAVLHYNVYFDKPGEYFLWTRLRSNDEEDNTIQGGIDGTWPPTAKILQSPVNKKEWIWKNENRLSRTPWKIGRASLEVREKGLHDVQFCMREDGEEFDRFILTTDPNFTIAEGVGPKVTLRQGKLPAAFSPKETVATKPLFMVNPDGTFYGAKVLFQVTKGSVAIEAEDFYRQSLAKERMWHLVTPRLATKIGPDSDAVRLAGASGEAYLELLPDARQKDEDKVNSKTSIHGEGGQGAVLGYLVAFDKPGKYYVWVRGRNTDGDDNTLHVGLGDLWPESGKKMMFKARDWAWSNLQRDTNAKIAVEVPKAGSHELKLSMREDGCEIDRIFVTDDEKALPTDAAASAAAIKKGNLAAWHKDREARMDAAFTLVPDGRRVVMEAESAPASDGWRYKADDGSFSGFGYLEWDQAGQGIAPGKGVLSYSFAIDEPGTYQIFVRSKMKDPANRPETPDPDGNDVWMKLTGGRDVPGRRALGDDWNKIAILGHPVGWTWNTNADSGKPHPPTPVLRAFDKGIYSLDLSGRSQGHAIDKIVLVKVTKPVTDFDGAAAAKQLAGGESRRVRRPAAP